MLPQLFLQEALRLFPSVPFFGRKLTEDCKFGEMTTVNIWLSILFSVFGKNGVRLIMYIAKCQIYLCIHKYINRYI